MPCTSCSYTTAAAAAAIADAADAADAAAPYAAAPDAAFKIFFFINTNIFFVISIATKVEHLHQSLFTVHSLSS